MREEKPGRERQPGLAARIKVLGFIGLSASRNVPRPDLKSFSERSGLAGLFSRNAGSEGQVARGRRGELDLLREIRRRAAEGGRGGRSAARHWRRLRAAGAAGRRGIGRDHGPVDRRPAFPPRLAPAGERRAPGTGPGIERPGGDGSAAGSGVPVPGSAPSVDRRPRANAEQMPAG